MKKLPVLLCIFTIFSVQAVYLGAQAGRNPSPGANRTQGFLNDAISGMGSAFTEMDTEPTPVDLYFLGRAVSANILASYKPYTGNPALTRYVNLICKTIVINSPDIELFNGCYVSILDSPEFNGFASPGGHIFVTKGLVELVSTEDMLAAVIAHELAHIKLKHGSSIIADMRFYDDMLSISDQAVELSGRNSPAVQRLMNFRDSVTALIDTMFKNGYSQTQEFEADQEALILLALSGYNPRALPEVLGLLQRAEASKTIGLTATHPSPQERIANIDRLIRDRQFRDTGSYRAPRFKNR